jgi:regulator of sigma E protease
LLSVLALIVTLGVLISFHELGHFWVARRCGVKVLRFSIGFGKPLWLRRGRVDGTEYAVAAIPLGGYVRMLDEREGDVSPDETHRAFNRQSVWARIAIVAAGPLFNFVFAIFAYSLMFMVGVTGLRPIMDAPSPGSIAAGGGFESGDLITSVDGRPTPTMDVALLALVDRSMAREVIKVEVRDREARERLRLLDMRDAPGAAENGEILANLGLNPWRPTFPPVIDKLKAGGAAERAGLEPGDLILTVDDEPVESWQSWADYVRARPGQAFEALVERAGESLRFQVVPEAVETEQGRIGLIGAYGKVPDGLIDSYSLVVRYGPLDALVAAVAKTWDMSMFTLRMLGRMLVGTASLENISGPITIAQYAGQSASIGWTAFLSFLALVSISLGVLNLLPIPILDGGHLLYYFVEVIKGSPVSESVQNLGQRLGIVVLIMLMSLALFNDLTRLLS